MRGRLGPIPEAPALLLSGKGLGSPILIIADLHLGLGAVSRAIDGPPGARAEDLAADLTALCRSARARRVIVAGDVKHPIVGTPGPLRPVVFDFFSTLLARGIAVDVVLGNHDVGLPPHLPREVHVHTPRGIVVGGVGIFHGHCWPSPRVLAARTWVVGHLHPGFRLAPSEGNPTGKQRCWVRAGPRAVPATDGVVTARPEPAEELIVLPAFHPLAGTEALNRERPRRGRSFLFQRFLAGRDCRAYLLDGTDLGRLSGVPSLGPPRAGVRAGVRRP